MSFQREYPAETEGGTAPSEMHETPQLLETGISADYRNAFLSFELFAKKYGPALRDKLPEPHRIKRYEEWLPAGTYGEVVNDHNRKTVTELDGIVNELNMMLEDTGRFEAQRFIELCDHADALILGRTEQKAA